MERQDQQMHSDLKISDQLPQSQEECINPAQASLRDVQASIRTTLHPEKERDRLEWESTPTRNSERALKQSQQIQSPLNVPMLSPPHQDM